MKYVIVLFLFLNQGCFLDPTPSVLELEKPSIPSGVTFSISIEDDSFFYQKKKIESKAIKELVQKFKKKNKENRKIVMEIRPTKGAKIEYVLFLLELAEKEDLGTLLRTIE